MKNASDYFYYLVHYSKQLEKQTRAYINHFYSMGWYKQIMCISENSNRILSSFVIQVPLNETDSCLKGLSHEIDFKICDKNLQNLT